MRTTLGLAVCTSAAFVLATGQALAARPASCTIAAPSSDPVVVQQGNSVTYTGQVSNGAPPYNVTWTFEGGTPGSDTGTISVDGGSLDSVPVFYNAAGTYTTTFVTTGQSKDCNAATRTVQVQAAGGNPPVAVNDTANTNIGTPSPSTWPPMIRTWTATWIRPA